LITNNPSDMKASVQLTPFVPRGVVRRQ